MTIRAEDKITVCRHCLSTNLDGLMSSDNALDVVRETAHAKRSLETQLAVAQHHYANALRAALETHTRDQVAEAAGTSYQAVYQALAKRFGKRRTRAHSIDI